MLRVIQLNTLEDRAVHDKNQWDSAVKFLEKSLKEKLDVNEENLKEQVSRYSFMELSFLFFKTCCVLSNLLRNILKGRARILRKMDELEIRYTRTDNKIGYSVIYFNK